MELFQEQSYGMSLRFLEQGEESKGQDFRPDVPPPSPANFTEEKGCKCSKIGCLKLYCECFTSGRLCSQKCICKDCKNTCAHPQQILAAKRLANERKPGLFKEVAEPRPVRKCTCRKSKCLKKYCECLSAGLKCGQWCKCLDCHNCEDKSRLDQMQIEIEVY